VQSLPYEVDDGCGGVSIPQPSVVEPGSRTVSDSMRVATRWEKENEFVPRI
jgi:hypothetical protein